jgi:hypothetical protein
MTVQDPAARTVALAAVPAPSRTSPSAALEETEIGLLPLAAIANREPERALVQLRIDFPGSSIAPSARSPSPLKA